MLAKSEHTIPNSFLFSLLYSQSHFLFHIAASPSTLYGSLLISRTFELFHIVSLLLGLHQALLILNSTLAIPNNDYMYLFSVPCDVLVCVYIVR